jgi:hypothetical protein
MSSWLVETAIAYSGLLVVDFTVFVLTISRSIKLRSSKEPFLHRLFIDGTSTTHAFHSANRHYNIIRFSVLWVWRKLYWGERWTDLSVSVISSLNLVNIVLLVCQVLLVMYSVRMKPPCFSSNSNYRST